MQILISNNGAGMDENLQRLQHRDDYQSVETIDCRVTTPEVRRRCPDVLLMDVAEDDWGARETLREIRAYHAELPIIAISTTVSSMAAVAYLNAGADDFVRKPFDLEELTARIAAVYRRTHRPQTSGSTIHAGPVVIDDRCKRVTVFDKEVTLSPKEYQLLQLCASEPGKVFSHDEISECLWPRRGDGENVDIKQYVHLLRTKLGRVPGGRNLIENVKGFGYRLTSGELGSAEGLEAGPRVVGQN